MVGAALVTAVTVGGKVVNAVPKIVGWIKGLFKKSEDPEAEVKAAFNSAMNAAKSEQEREVIRQYQQQAQDYIRTWYANLDPASLPDYLKNISEQAPVTALKRIKMYKNYKGQPHAWDSVEPIAPDLDAPSDLPSGVQGKVEGASAWVTKNPLLAVGAAALLYFILKKR